MKKFKNIFKKNYTYKASAHARVNLIGEHTDYTGGYVLPILINYKTEIFICHNKQINGVHSTYYNETIFFDNYNKSKNNHWVDYVKGCLFTFISNYSLPNQYFNILIDSNIPLQKGVSSSSALCVALLKSLNQYYQLNINNKNIALLAQKVEREYIGVKGGIMDQMVSSFGIFNKAFFLNCRTLDYKLINLPQDYIFCLIDSKIQRDLRESSYNERYNELKEAEKILKVKYLSDTSLKELNNANFKNLLIKKRARHVISENERVLKAKKALENNDMDYFGRLMNESHKSYTFDFEASNEEVNTITKQALNNGAIGARLTGGGFGGFIVSLIKRNQFNTWKSKMLVLYHKNRFLN